MHGPETGIVPLRDEIAYRHTLHGLQQHGKSSDVTVPKERVWSPMVPVKLMYAASQLGLTLDLLRTVS